MSTKPQVPLAAHFPGVNNTTIWSDERAESQIAFSSFEHFARNAERGCFDYLKKKEVQHEDFPGGHPS